MINFLHTFGQKHRPWVWIVFCCTLFAWLLFSFVVFPALTFELDGVKLQILDLRIWYSAFDVKSLFDGMGEIGRDTYRFQVVFVDMVYPIVYAALIMSTMLLIMSKLKHDIKFKNLLYLPLFAFIFDVFENLNTFSMLHQYRDITAFQAFMGSFLTSLKWASVSLAFGAVLFLIGALIFQYFKPTSGSKFCS